MGNDQQVEGQWDKAKGSVKEGVGDLTDNEKMEYEGKMDKTKGTFEKGIGDVRDTWDQKDDTTRQP